VRSAGREGTSARRCRAVLLLLLVESECDGSGGRTWEVAPVVLLGSDGENMVSQVDGGTATAVETAVIR
jgi:hypothetical protein